MNELLEHVIWEGKGSVDDFGTRMRIITIDEEECIVEIITRNNVPFRERLRQGLSWILGGKNFILATAQFHPEDLKDLLRRVKTYYDKLGREDCEG